MYAAIYKEMRVSLQSGSKESGQEDASQVEQNKRQKRHRNSEGIYLWKMWRWALKETPLKHLEPMKAWA
jgi:hypothetical protein